MGIALNPQSLYRLERWEGFKVLATSGVCG